MGVGAIGDTPAHVLVRRYLICARIWTVAIGAGFVMVLVIPGSNLQQDSPFVTFVRVYWFFVMLTVWPLYWLMWRVWRAGWSPITQRWRQRPPENAEEST